MGHENMTMDLIYPVILFFAGLCNIYWGIRSIKTRNLYWAAPTISGFKNRKKEKDPLWVAILTGTSGILLGIFLIFISFMAIKTKSFLK